MRSTKFRLRGVRSSCAARSESPARPPPLAALGHTVPPPLRWTLRSVGRCVTAAGSAPQSTPMNFAKASKVMPAGWAWLSTWLSSK
jgi:hypothetical protein